MKLRAGNVVRAIVGKRAIGWALDRVQSHPAILLYHGVSVGSVSGNLRNCEGKHIPRDAFAEHLKTLRRSRRVIPLHEMVERLHRGEDLRRAVAITFDDGYENNALIAAPLLADANMSATFFLTTGFIGTGRFMWTDKLETMLDRTAASSVVLRTTGRVMSLCSLEDKRIALGEIKAALKLLPHSQCLGAVEEFADQLRVGECLADGDYRFMNWDQARSLVRAGFAVGAHTANHPILSRIPLEAAQDEILGSRDRINAELGQCSTTFCYPNGRATDYTKELTEFCKRHFRAALSANRGPARVEEIYELRRFGATVGPAVSDIEWMLLSEH